jgi:hypothetical protein
VVFHKVRKDSCIVFFNSFEVEGAVGLQNCQKKDIVKGKLCNHWKIVFCSCCASILALLLKKKLAKNRQSFFVQKWCKIVLKVTLKILLRLKGAQNLREAS